MNKDKVVEIHEKHVKPSVASLVQLMQIGRTNHDTIAETTVKMATAAAKLQQVPFPPLDQGQAAQAHDIINELVSQYDELETQLSAQVDIFQKIIKEKKHLVANLKEQQSHLIA